MDELKEVWSVCGSFTYAGEQTERIFELRDPEVALPL